MNPPENSAELPDSAEDASFIEDVQTAPSVNTASAGIVAALHALNTLTQLALAESTARSEARHQVAQLASSLTDLARFSLSMAEPDAGLRQAWERLTTELADLTTPVPDPDDEEEDAPAVELPSDEVSRRLGLTIPPHMRQPDNTPGETALRRVLVASLETNGEASLLTGQAAASFSRDEWNVTNLGANVPIMALTGTVMETRPSVLALVLGQGEFVAETGRLIADLRRQLFGLRIMALGPALTEPTLAERLRLELFSPEVAKAAELAGQFFNPLLKLGSPLHLSLELSETPDEMTPEPDAKNETEESEPLG